MASWWGSSMSTHCVAHTHIHTHLEHAPDTHLARSQSAPIEFVTTNWSIRYVYICPDWGWKGNIIESIFILLESIDHLIEPNICAILYTFDHNICQCCCIQKLANQLASPYYIFTVIRHTMIRTNTTLRLVCCRRVQSIVCMYVCLCMCNYN